MTVFFNGISAKGIHKLHHAIYSKFIPPPGPHCNAKIGVLPTPSNRVLQKYIPYLPLLV